MTREEAIKLAMKACKETWNEKTCKQIRNALEQEPILDKIRAEIKALEYLNIEDGSDGYDKYIEQYEVLKIIDKYKAESEMQK